MFSGCNETTFNSSNEFDVGKEKKSENVSKWWHGCSAGTQQFLYQQSNCVPDFWSPKSNFIGMQKCNCSDCYSSFDNQSYQNNTTCHRPWLPKAFPVPVNNSNELCKLPNYQWENSLPTKTSYGAKTNIPNFNGKEIGGKYQYHRLAETNQHGAITSLTNSDIVKHPKDEISNEMGFFEIPKTKQQVFYNPARNLSKSFNNSELYNLGEKYQKVDSFKCSSVSHSSEYHASRPPVVEPYTKVVPFLQNCVPSTGQQSFKDDVAHPMLESSFNDTQKALEESNELLDNKHLKLYHCQMGKEITNIYPMHGVGPGLKNTGMVQHYPYNLQSKNSYNSENQKLSFENLQSDDFFVRKKSPPMVTSSSCDLESGKQWQINQMHEHFSDGSMNNFKGSCGTFIPEIYKDNKILRPKKIEKGNPSFSQVNDNIIRNENFRFSRPEYNDFRPQNYFPCQNNSSTFRNYIRSDYPPQGYSVPSRHEHHPVTHEKFQYQYAQKNPQQPLQNYNASQFMYHGTSASALNSGPQQAENKNIQQQVLPFKDKPYNISEEFRITNVTKNDYLETIKSEDVNKSKNNKISPLRLLRKKKNFNPNDSEPVPISKNSSGLQNLDVRKFFSTWVEEEEENEVPTQVLVLDCQNLDPEQTKFLYVYDNDGIVTLKSADSVKETEKVEEAQELKEGLFLTVDQGNAENVGKEEIKNSNGTLEHLSVLEQQPPVNCQENVKLTGKLPLQESNATQDEPKPVKQENCFNFNEEGEVFCGKKVETKKMLDESIHFDKWTEKKFDFLKKSEESKAAEILRHEEQKKILEKRNSVCQIPECKILTSNSNPNKLAEKIKESSPLTKTNPQTNSPLSNDSPSLPTCEYRRNKFLNFTNQIANISPERNVEVKAGQNVNDHQKTSNREIFYQQEESIEQECLNNSSLDRENIDFNSKLNRKSDNKTVEFEDVTTKMPEINIESADIKIERENSDKKLKMSHIKRMKKSKKINRECENDDTSDKVTVDQIKFSIQKSHDLKISFKVLNSAANKYEDNEERIEENVSQSNSNENSNSTELITLKLKSIQNGDLTESNRGFRRKKLKKDNQNTPDVRIKKCRYFEEKDPVAADENYEKNTGVPEVSSFQDDPNDFQVKETVDSAKIKLTFKRHKSSFETECKVNQGIDDLGASDLENRPRKKWKKMKRREKGSEVVKTDLSSDWSPKNKNSSQIYSKENKFAPEEDLRSCKFFVQEEKGNTCGINSSLAEPLSPTKENITPCGDTSVHENKSNDAFSSKTLDEHEKTLENKVDNFDAKVDELEVSALKNKSEDENQMDESGVEFTTFDSSLNICSGKKIFLKTEKENNEVSFDCNQKNNINDLCLNCVKFVEKTDEDFVIPILPEELLYQNEKTYNKDGKKEAIKGSEKDVETVSTNNHTTITSSDEVFKNKEIRDENQNVENVFLREQKHMEIENRYEENKNKEHLSAEKIKKKDANGCKKDSVEKETKCKNWEFQENINEGLEGTLEKLEEKEKEHPSKQIEVIGDEYFEESIEKFFDVDEVVEKVNQTEILQSSFTLNLNKSEKNYGSPGSGLPVAMKNNECKISESEDIKTNSSAAEVAKHFDSLEENTKDENQQKNILNHLQSSEYPVKISRKWKSQEHLVDFTKEENQFVKISKSFSSTFSQLETAKQVNFCNVDFLTDRKLTNEGMPDKTSSLTLPLCEINESDTNILKQNPEGQSVEVTKIIYKASNSSESTSRTTKAGERKIVNGLSEEMQISVPEIKKVENFDLKKHTENLSFKRKGSLKKSEFACRIENLHKKVCSINKIIKRRNSLDSKFYGCDDLLNLSSSNTRLVRPLSCPPRITFLNSHNIPQLDIPVEEIPLPQGNPLPENIFDFKKYFMDRIKQSDHVLKNNMETKRSDSKIKEKLNYQKSLTNRNNEEERKISFENSNLSSKDEPSLQEHSKIKFSLRRQKNLKSIFTECEVDGSTGEKKVVNACRDKLFRTENFKLLPSCNEKVLKGEKICPNNLTETHSVTQNVAEEVIGNKSNSQETKVEDECSTNFTINFEQAQIISSTHNEDREGANQKLQYDLEFQIVEEMDEEPSIATDFIGNNCIESEFYKCEDIPTSEDLTNGEGEIEDQKVSDDDKFRNIMQNCLDNAKKFLNEGNLKLISCSVESLLELNCEETNTKNDVLEAIDNHISRDVLLTSCIGGDMSLPEKFQPMDVTDEYVPSFTAEGPHNLCSEILPVDNWPYLEEEVPSSPQTQGCEDTDLIPSLENIVSQNSLIKGNVTQEKNNKLFSGNKYLKHLRRRSMLAEVNSFVSISKPKKQRRKTVDCFTESIWSHQKQSKKVIREIRKGLENILHKSVTLKYQSNVENSTKKIENGNEAEEKLLNRKKTINYKSSKWQPKVILFRISKRELEKRLKKIKQNNYTCNVGKETKTEISEEISLKPPLEEQSPHDSVNLLLELRKKNEDSLQYLKVNPGIKSRNREIQENNTNSSAKDLELITRKKSRFRNLYSKEKKESKLLYETKDNGTLQNLLPKTSSLVDTKKFLSQTSIKSKKDFLNSEAKLTHKEEKKNKSESDTNFSERKDKIQIPDLSCSKNGLVKEIEKKLNKKNPEHSIKPEHHHSKRNKHKHHRDRKERKDSPRSNHKRRDKSLEKFGKRKNSGSSTQAEDPHEEPPSEKPWICQVCGFNDANERVSHIKSHSFHCQSCHLAFKTELFFVNHLTEKHKDIRNQHHCLLCELSFDTEKQYLRHLETREHRHLESVEKNTINTLFTLLTGQPCPVLGVVEMKPEWLPNQAGTVHFYHQATPLSLALQYLKMHHELSSNSNVPSPHSN